MFSCYGNLLFFGLHYTFVIPYCKTQKIHGNKDWQMEIMPTVINYIINTLILSMSMQLKSVKNLFNNM